MIGVCAGPDPNMHVTRSIPKNTVTRIILFYGILKVHGRKYDGCLQIPLMIHKMNIKVPQIISGQFNIGAHKDYTSMLDNIIFPPMCSLIDAVQFKEWWLFPLISSTCDGGGKKVMDAMSPMYSPNDGAITRVMDAMCPMYSPIHLYTINIWVFSTYLSLSIIP